jgi:hypothetical protein
MDLSKLPKLSQRPPDAPPMVSSGVEPKPVEAMPMPSMPGAGPVSGAMPHPPANPYALGRIGFVETWMSVGIGVLILLIMPRFVQWISSKLFHTNFVPFTLPDDTVVPYTSVPAFYSDLGPTLLGVALILDGLLFLTRRKPAVMFALMLTLLSTLYNLGYVVYSYCGPDGLLPVWSFMAVLFGGMMLTSQWLALKSFPAKKPRATVSVA